MAQKKHLFHFTFTALCVVLIWYLCLFRPPHIHSLELIPNFDKFVHCTMYLGTCSVFWVEYYYWQTRWAVLQRFLIAFLAPILMSGLIELAQEHLTTYRSGDWADFAANSTGVVLSLVSMFVCRHYFRKREA